jgi:hypothetical protein
MRPAHSTTKPAYTGYDWIHPSWRDLVIEHMRDNAAIRCDFLSRCGTYGILLSLSRGGGVKGERNTPLLSTKNDWLILKRRVSALVKQEPLERHQDLINAVLGLLARPEVNHKSRLTDTAMHGELTDLARGLLSDCRKEWNSRKLILVPSTLSSYYRLSELLSPLPSSPDLEATWTTYYNAICDAMDDYHAGCNLTSRAFETFFHFVGICFLNEPRFLRQKDYPNCLSARMSRFLLAVKEEDTDTINPGPEDEMAKESSRLESIESALNSVSVVGEALRSEAEKRGSELRTLIDQIDDFIRENYSDEPEPEPSHSYSPRDDFILEELFADL